MQRSYRNLTLVLIVGVALVFQCGPLNAAGDAGAIWGADYFPNVPLVTQDGKTVHFFDDLIKDKVVVINFIFTRCADVCPLETARLREVQKILGDRVGKDVFMYSITVDPSFDKPAVLKAYRERFQIGPGWLFLTGKEEDITLLRKKLGLYNEEEQGGNLSAHTLSLLIGNQSTGRWMKGSPFENPYVLATQVGSWLHNWKLPPTARRNYADAPEVRNISAGENLFRTRCAACHTIGSGDIRNPEKRRIGPDLYGVTQKREREWLIRFIMAPDRMLAEKDPLALALLAAYDNVPMPDLRLNRSEAESLLTYIDEESQQRERESRAPGTEGAAQAPKDGRPKQKGE